MANLLIDIGNSRLKWAVEEQTMLKRGADIDLTEVSSTEIVSQHWLNLNIDQALISCVANRQIENELIKAIHSHLGIQPQRLVSPDAGSGIQNAYSEPERLGSDRWAAMVAAYERVKGAVCVVDCGTAVTLDAIDKTGQHLGGLIIPGLTTSQRSLNQFTNMDFSAETGLSSVNLLGQSTEQCIQFGAFLQITSLIRSVYTDLCHQHGAMALMLTGGDAVAIQSGLNLQAQLEPDLVLKGLAIILRTQVETSSS